jgi:hypothetical protein
MAERFPYPDDAPPMGSTEAGAALIMALVFITIGSLLSISLANLSGANLLNSTGLQNQRNSEYAADAAMSEATQAVRYYGGSPPCEPITSPTLNGDPIKVDGYFYYVSCSGTPMTIPVSQFSGTTVTAPAGQAFVTDDVNLEVEYFSSTGTLLGISKVSSYDSNSTLTVYTGPSAFTGTATAKLFEPYGRIELMAACVSASSVPNGCDPNSSSPKITAVVHFSDINSSGGAALGYGLDIKHWDVRTANG